MTRAIRAGAGAMLVAALCAGVAAAQGLPDSTADRSTFAAPDTLVAPAIADTAVVDTAVADTVEADAVAPPPPPPTRPAAPVPEPPLNISADNVTGTHGPEGDTVYLNGNVRIIRGRTVITSETGRYLRSQGMLFLDDNVRMVDSTTVVTSDHVSYSELEDVLQLFGNVKIVDGDGTLRAPSGTYNRRTGRGDLFGGVTATQDEQTMTADRAIYWRDSMVVQARGNVRAVDDANELELRAESVDYDRFDRVAVAIGEPVLYSTDEKGIVTELRAAQLRLDTRARIAEATDSVRVKRDSLHAFGDYARFSDETQEGILLGNPRVWDDQSVVTGDTLEIRAEDRIINRVIVRSNAVMEYVGVRPESVGEETRLEGDRVDVYFTEQEIDSLVATGNARNSYQAPADPGMTHESNVANGDTITIFFKDRKVQRARVDGVASGRYRMAVAEDDTLAAQREIIDYEARRIEFEVPKSRIVLDGNSHVEYGDMVLEAKRVQFDVDGQSLTAEGDPQLMDRGDRVEGHLMTYDLNTRVGTIYQAETTFERGLYHGEQIRKVGDDELNVLRGDYSTCELDSPHYHFSAKWMKIYLKDKLVAKPVVFYVKNVPLLALPFWVFPIKPGRHSGFLFPQFELGFNNQAGQFIRNAGYYWAPNDYMDFTFTGDYYRAEPSWVLRTESRYKLLYLLDGDFRASFARNERAQRDDWDFTANHQQTIDPNTRLIARASFVSSRNYSASNLYGNTLAQRLNRFLTSSIALSRNTSWASFNAVVDRRQDLDADLSISDPDGEGPLQGPPPGTTASLANLTQNEPSLSVSFPTRQVGGLPLLRRTALENPFSTVYFGAAAQYLSYRQQRAYVDGYRYFINADSSLDSTTTIAQNVSVRRALASQFSVSDNRRIGWLTVRPAFSGNVVVFDHDNLGNKVVPTGTWSTSLTTSTTFYGTALPRWGRLEGVRHIIYPSVSFQYSPDFPHLTYVDSLGITRERFTGFGGISVSGFKSASMSFRLDQRFQVKLRHPDGIQRLDNLLSWGVSGSYNFLWRERNLEHPLSLISSSIRLQPPRLVDATFSWVTDVYNPRPVRSVSLSLNARLSSSGWGASQDPLLPVDESTNRGTPGPSWYRDAWSIIAAFSHAGGYSSTGWSTQQTLNGIVHYQLSPAWTVDWSASYDITRRSMQTQRFSLSRDLHCWNMSFTRTFIVGGEAEYYFRIGIKEQPEVFVERGTRAGSIGGLN